ncbi:hypothetical protein Tco_0816084 [Tanacetum coccineum]
MTALADKAVLSGADNRPPMLEKDMYDSWKSRMELYMMNRQHGRMILESVENGLLIWPTIEENERRDQRLIREKIKIAYVIRSTKGISDCELALNKKNLYYTQDLLFQEAMDSQSTQTIKLPILQPENGNAPIVTKTVDGKETVIPPTSVEEKAQRRA